MSQFFLVFFESIRNSWP